MKEHRYDDYGIDGIDLEAARVLVEEALGVELEERESSYYAGNYFCLRQNFERPIMLYRNFDPTTSTWVREHYQAHPVIMEVARLHGMEELHERLLRHHPYVVLLKHSVHLVEDDRDKR